MADPYLSQITAYGCNYAIRDWNLCYGQVLDVVQNGALFSLLGTNFGGNGIQTFGVPDLRGRSALGMGTMPGGYTYPLGQKYGFEDVVLTIPNLPTHSVTVNSVGTTSPVTTTIEASSSGPDTSDPAGAFQGTFPPTSPVYASTLTAPIKAFGAVNVPGQAITVSGTSTPIGSNSPLENRSPYQVVNWQICVDGLYPPRN